MGRREATEHQVQQLVMRLILQVFATSDGMEK